MLRLLVMETGENHWSTCTEGHLEAHLFPVQMWNSPPTSQLRCLGHLVLWPVGSGVCFCLLLTSPELQLQRQLSLSCQGNLSCQTCCGHSNGSRGQTTWVDILALWLYDFCPDDLPSLSLFKGADNKSTSFTGSFWGLRRVLRKVPGTKCSLWLLAMSTC